jgi:hypothetical protein
MQYGAEWDVPTIMLQVVHTLEEAQLRLERWSMSARLVQPVVGVLYQDTRQKKEQLGFRPGHSRDRAILPLRLRQLLRL